MLDRDNEIRYLKHQIDKATKTAALKEHNMQATENLIKTMQVYMCGYVQLLPCSSGCESLCRSMRAS